MLALAQSATVVPEAWPSTRRRQPCGYSWPSAAPTLKGQVDDHVLAGRYVVAFNSESSASVQPPFFQRTLVLSFKSEAALATDIGTVVQFNPNTSSASFPSLLSTRMARTRAKSGETSASATPGRPGSRCRCGARTRRGTEPAHRQGGDVAQARGPRPATPRPTSCGWPS